MHTQCTVTFGLKYIMIFSGIKYRWQFSNFSNRCCLIQWRLKHPGFLAHLSRRLLGELIVYPCSGVRRCRRLSPFSNIYICKTYGPNATKFYLRHHWGEEKAALGFGPDQIRTLISMATDSSNRVIMGKTAESRFLKGF